MKQIDARTLGPPGLISVLGHVSAPFFINSDFHVFNDSHSLMINEAGRETRTR
jgi:hypothetical protein